MNLENQLSDLDKKNLRLLNSLIKTTNLSGKTNFKKDGVYTPILKRGHVIQCEFTGIGEELDFLHFAIVWNAKKNEETINVIPLTSKFKEESVASFYLGQIENFITKENNSFVNKESYIYVNKLMEVSRKRIRPVFKQNINGEMITESNGAKILVEISEEQKQRIKESIELFYLDSSEFLLEKLQSYSNNYFIDLESCSEEIFSCYGYRKISDLKIEEIDENNNRLSFLVNKNRQSLILKKLSESNWQKFKSDEHKDLYENIKYEKNLIVRRNNILEALFSRNELKVIEAKVIITDIFD
ncbi:TPA: hypothetical protein I9065_003008 [Clostridium perfringens]|nr:hypothetical protein [Clostridium perfringens]